MTTSLVIVGDTLLDRDLDGRVERLAPDAPVPVVDQVSDQTRPGGAGLAALLSRLDGSEVTLVTAVGRDEAAGELRRLLDDGGVRLLSIDTDAPTPEKIRIRGQGRPLVRLDRGSGPPGNMGTAGADISEAFARADGILVSDYGRGITSHPDIVSLLASSAPGKPTIWDPHPRGSSPVRGCSIITPNREEAALFTPDIDGNGHAAMGERARSLLKKWSAGGVAVTLGSEGALFVDGSPYPLVVPPPLVDSKDPCGAGDRFAVSMIRELSEGRLPSEAVSRGVADSSQFVAMGGAGALHSAGAGATGPMHSQAGLLASRVRERGGTVVATGGCFDLIHPGHVALLQAARRLGDCLIVCLNSDESVERLKGPGRPVNGCGDRAAVLTALSSVDAVEVFTDTVPHDALRRIKPHVWVKGGDYGSQALPEAELIRTWGGEVVILPYLQGHSTTRILDRAASDA